MKLEELKPLIFEFNAKNPAFLEGLNLKWLDLANAVWQDCEPYHYEPGFKHEFNLKEYKLQIQILNLENSTAILRQMKKRLAVLVGSLRKLEQQFSEYIIFLFGLSSSQTAYIFHAFSGASLCRTPNL